MSHTSVSHAPVSHAPVSHTPASRPPVPCPPVSRASTPSAPEPARPHTPLPSDALVTVFASAAATDDPASIDHWLRAGLSPLSEPGSDSEPTNPALTMRARISEFITACEHRDAPGQLRAFASASLVCGYAVATTIAVEVAAELVERARLEVSFPWARQLFAALVPSAEADDLDGWAELLVVLSTGQASGRARLRSDTLCYDAFHVAWLAARRLETLEGLPAGEALTRRPSPAA